MLKDYTSNNLRNGNGSQDPLHLGELNPLLWVFMEDVLRTNSIDNTHVLNSWLVFVELTIRYVQLALLRRNYID